MTEAAFSQAIGARIRERRQRLRMTQYSLALALDVKRSTICAWESSKRTVSAYDFSRIESFFARREAAALGKTERRA